MTGIKRILTVCLGILGMCVHGAYADDSADAMARAATRRDASTTVTRTQDSSAATQINTSSGISRATTPRQSGVAVRSRSTTSQPSIERHNVVSRDGGTRNTSAASQSVSARNAATVLPRASTSAQSVVSSPSRAATTSRTATVQRASTTGTRTDTVTSAPSRSAVATASISRTATPNSGRTVTNNSSRIARAGVTAEDIINRDYTTCREVYYSCMDEFCANKDSQLKRCACSARVNEFDGVKAQLAEIEDRLLDFNQRLLTVNMDKEDAAAISQATEGELAFQKEDTSASKELLDEIAEKLNTTFDTSTFDANLAPITLSLNADAAFDSVDSLAGASTTTRSGTDLYAAALPVCREMAMEVCTADELDIVESGYQMAIEQDCNTVAKAYQTQQDLAREKIREGSALLDISRLDTYQKRNSDDILTCKKKMLDMLTNTAVCGENLEKCLDISGQYIDPSTGEAILTSNLVNLGSLITRPQGDQTWTGAPGNDKFVQYLNSKKMFLESATENCQDIADYVWDEFIDDALAQIKLAQESKLEEVRQSCTTLTTQCLSDAADSLEDFDARALSIFGVEADKTVNQMCAEVKESCTALLETTSGGMDWSTGMTDIATDKTYDTILQTCREVGRACIIQSCKSISGNFGLCEDIQTSINRKSIINRTACWDEVLDCVTSAGADAIQAIADLHQAEIDATNGSFYTQLYGSFEFDDITNKEMLASYKGASCINSSDGNCIYDICSDECGYDPEQGGYTDATSDECRICRLAERVWGNCEAHPTANLETGTSHNKIKTPINGEETLLSWFAQNTNTEDYIDNCRDTSCGPGFKAQYDPQTNSTVCVSSANFDTTGEYCPASQFWQVSLGGVANCCKIDATTAGSRDAFGNCCMRGSTIKRIKGLRYWTSPPTIAGSYYPTTNGSVQISQSNPADVISGNNPPSPTGLCLPENVKFVASIYYLKAATTSDIEANAATFNRYYVPTATALFDFLFLFCDGDVYYDNQNDRYPGGQTVGCTGRYIIVSKNTGKYMAPLYIDDNGKPLTEVSQYPTSSYTESESSGNTCNLTYHQPEDATTSQWDWVPATNTNVPDTGEEPPTKVPEGDPCSADSTVYRISY